MQANNILSIPRLGLLFRQGFIHNYKMIGISLVAFCGGLFLLLLGIQLVGGDNAFDSESFSGTFLFVVIPMAIIYTGTAFPAFRSKEKSYSYLLVPASTFEKFIFEFFNRVVLFLIIMPLAYWLVFNLEGHFVVTVKPSYAFAPRTMADLLAVVHDPEPAWKYAVVVFVLLIFTIPFAGAASFTKFPLPKTLFIVALLFFFNLFMVYLFVEVFEFKNYHLQGDNQSILFMEGEAEALRALTGYGLVINAGLLLTTYFKLREKEV
jgi:hypothetical protein